MAMKSHDCLSHYRYGGVVPWTCPGCGQVWTVKDQQFVKAGELPPPFPQHDHEPVEAGAPCRVCGVPEKEHE